jgi:hypothetical protein
MDVQAQSAWAEEGCIHICWPIGGCHNQDLERMAGPTTKYGSLGCNAVYLGEKATQCAVEGALSAVVVAARSPNGFQLSPPPRRSPIHQAKYTAEAAQCRGVADPRTRQLKKVSAPLP